MDSLKVMKEGNWSIERYVVNGVERKNVFPYELSDAVLDEKVREEKRRERVEVEARVDRSTYIPPPL